MMRTSLAPGHGPRPSRPRTGCFETNRCARGGLWRVLTRHLSPSATYSGTTNGSRWHRPYLALLPQRRDAPRRAEETPPADYGPPGPRCRPELAGRARCSICSASRPASASAATARAAAPGRAVAPPICSEDSASRGSPPDRQASCGRDVRSSSTPDPARRRRQEQRLPAAGQGEVLVPVHLVELGRLADERAAAAAGARRRAGVLPQPRPPWSARRIHGLLVAHGVA